MYRQGQVNKDPVPEPDSTRSSRVTRSWLERLLVAVCLYVGLMWFVNYQEQLLQDYDSMGKYVEKRSEKRE